MEMFGIETTMTDSAKTARYLPNLSKADVILASLKECPKTASKG
jgi:predicted aconitase